MWPFPGVAGKVRAADVVEMTDDATVTRADVPVNDGVVRVIDSVWMPPAR